MSNKLPPPPLDAPFGAYGWNDWYRKVRDIINEDVTIPFASITDKPTTLAGYGITDPVVVMAGGNVTTPTSINAATGFFNASLSSFNSPVGGTPSKWIVFNDAGTLRTIPTWAL